MTLDSNPAAGAFPNHGYWLDGKSPRQQTLSLRLAKDGVQYRLHSGETGLWKFADTDWAHSPLYQLPLYLKSLTQEDAWLVITDAKAARHVVVARKNWAVGNFWVIHAEKRRAVLSCLGIMALFAVLWLVWPFIADQIAAKAPDSLRASLNHIGDDYLQGEKQCSTPESAEALATIQKRLAQQHPQLLDSKITILNKKAINAFTLPGNRVVLTSGLLAQAKSDDEIAGVLAHEFGHVLNDHVMRGFLRNSLPRMTVSILSRILGTFPALADMFIGNAYSRGFEHDADAAAVVLLRDAHISPKGLESFFDRMEKKEGSSHMLMYLNDHPPAKNRAAMMAAANAEQGDIQPLLTDSQWQDLQNACTPRHAAN